MTNNVKVFCIIGLLIGLFLSYKFTNAASDRRVSVSAPTNVTPPIRPLAPSNELPTPPAHVPQWPLGYQQVYYDQLYEPLKSGQAPDWVLKATHCNALREENTDQPTVVAQATNTPTLIATPFVQPCFTFYKERDLGLLTLPCSTVDEYADLRLAIDEVGTGVAYKGIVPDIGRIESRYFFANAALVVYLWSRPKYNDNAQDKHSWVQAYTRSNGELLWQVATEPLQSDQLSGAIFADGVVLVNGQHVRKLDAHTGHLIWQAELLDAATQDFYLHNGVLYVASKVGYLYMLDWRTGFIFRAQDLTRTLDPGLHRLCLLAVDDKTITLAGQTKNLSVFAQLGHIGMARAPMPAPSLTPTPSPTATPLPTTSPPLPDVSSFVLPAPTPAPPFVAHPNWNEQKGEVAVQVDLDGDNVPEWLVLTQYLLDFNHAWIEGTAANGVKTETMPFAGNFLDYLLLKQENGHYRAVARLDEAAVRSHLGGTGTTPRILAVADINQDGRKEIVIYDISCSASPCFTRLSIWQWDGARFHDLLAAPIEISNVQFDFVDRAQDGTVTIEAIGGTIGIVGFGFERPDHFVYTWQAEQKRYLLTERTPVEKDFALFNVVDAQKALGEGDYERALALAQHTMTNPVAQNESIGSLYSDELNRIVTYAAIQTMYVHAQRGEIDVMRAALGQVKTKYAAADNPYTEVARVLLQIYEATGDPALACQILRRQIVNFGQRANLLRQETASTVGLNAQEICQAGGLAPLAMGQVAPLPTPTVTPTFTPSPEPSATAFSMPPQLNQLALPTPSPAPTLLPKFEPKFTWDAKVGVTGVYADLDGDGQKEWLISVEQLLDFNHAWDQVTDEKVKAHDPVMQEVLHDLNPWDYLIYAQNQAHEFVPVAHLSYWELGAGYGSTAFRPSILTVADINGDGKPEIVIYASGCSGTGTCFGKLSFWQWDGHVFKNLVRNGWDIKVVSPIIEFVDTNHDGKLEISIITGLSGYPGLGPQRPSHLVFGWQNGAYELLEETPVESEFGFYRVIDAQKALQDHDFDRALQLAYPAITEYSSTPRQTEYGMSEAERKRLATYAGIQAMYIYALRGEVRAMTATLRYIEEHHQYPENPYVIAARLFVESYQMTGDAELACHVLRAHVRLLGSLANVFTQFPVGPLDPALICPIPG